MGIFRKYKSSFLNDREKAIHYAAVSGVNLKDYPSETCVKVYEGAELMVFHTDQNDELVINAVMTCTNITATNQGLKITLIDRETFRISIVGDVPNRLFAWDIISHVPYRCMIERTLKRSQRKRPIQGLAAGVVIRARSGVDQRVPGHLQVMSMYDVKKWFTPEELEVAYNRVEEVKQ